MTRFFHLPVIVISLIASHVAGLQSSPNFLSDAAKIKTNKAQHVLEHQTASVTPKECTAKLTGPIETTMCDYETVESMNHRLFTTLHELVDTPFFKYIKINLARECPFWEDEGFCVMRDCAVTTVDEREIPEQWRAASLSQLQSPSEELRKYFPGCYYRDSDFCVLDDERDSGGEFVDLSLNPEKFTGYAGQAAHRVWRAIYEENCFGLSEKDFLPSSTVADEDYFDPTATSNFNRLGLTPLGEKALQHEKEEVCLEKKVYYRIISGLHASISTHICHETLDQKTGQWYPSLQCFIDRIASHPERLQHIYFNTVLLLRAVSRAGKYLEAYDVSLEGDGGSPRLLKEVIDMAGNIPSFDETALFQGEDANILKEEFKNHFRNVTRIMDCVGCDKCRLWGKIQTSGVGTALKILFELDEKALDPKLNPHLLQRSEVVALVNTLHRFSESLEAVDEFRKMWAARSRPSTSIPSVEPGTQSIEETRASSFPSSTESPPTASSPSTDNSNLSARILDACKKGTSNCLDFGARIVDGVANVFKVGGKEDLPRNEL